MGVKAVNVLRNERQKVAKERQTMYLELLQLRWLPSMKLRVVGARIKVKHDAAEEIVVHDVFMCKLTVFVSACVKDCCPENLFQLDVLIIGSEHILLLTWLDVISLLKTVKFIHCGVVHKCLHQGLTTDIVFKKEVMTFFLDDDIVYQDSQLVSEALIIKFVTLLNHIFERCSQVYDNCLVSSH